MSENLGTIVDVTCRKARTFLKSGDSLIQDVITSLISPRKIFCPFVFQVNLT